MMMPISLSFSLDRWALSNTRPSSQSRHVSDVFSYFISLKFVSLKIPKDMDEDLLLPFFSEFGPVAELTVIRDKINQTHKGMSSTQLARQFHLLPMNLKNNNGIFLYGYATSWSRLCISHVLYATVCSMRCRSTARQNKAPQCKSESQMPSNSVRSKMVVSTQCAIVFSFVLRLFPGD